MVLHGEVQDTTQKLQAWVDEGLGSIQSISQSEREYEYVPANAKLAMKGVHVTVTALYDDQT